MCCAQSLQQSPTLCDSMHCSWQAPLSMGFFRQEYWGGLPCPPPGIFQMQGPNLCLLHPLHCRQILYCWAVREAPCLHMLKVRLLKLQAVITSSESSNNNYITQHLSWAYLVRMKRTCSFHFELSLAFEQKKIRLIKALTWSDFTIAGAFIPVAVCWSRTKRWAFISLIFFCSNARESSKWNEQVLFILTK